MGLRDAVERLSGEVASADERADLAGVGIERDERALQVVRRFVSLPARRRRRARRMPERRALSMRGEPVGQRLLGGVLGDGS